MIRYLDVCSGYSAATLAWVGLGFRCVGYSEIEPFPRAILAERHGAVPVDWEHRWHEGANVTPLFGDFTQIEAHHVGPVDLLAGGTPCQAFSVAGKRLGLDDPRGNLTLEFLALARRLRVPWLVWENVPGILSHDDGRSMGTFLRLLGELGYGWAYRVLDVQYVRVDGAPRALPQRRRRVFVVGHLGESAGPAAVLFERESLRGDPAPRRSAGKDVAPTISARTRGGGGRGTDFDCDGGLVSEAFGGNDTRGPIGVATALNAHGGPAGRMDFESETFVAHALRADDFDASEDGTGRGTPIVPVAFRVTPNDGAYETGDHAPSLTTGTDRSACVVAFDTTQITSPNNRSPAVPGAPCHPLAASAHPPTVALQDFGWAVRRLTPTECERLMGVPDAFTHVTYRRKPAADGPRYKALGNSQGSNVMRWIGHGLAEVMATPTPNQQENAG